MCTAYAVRQHRLSVLVKVFSRSRARTGAAGSARSRPERSAAASTERSTTRAVAARSRPIRRPGGLRLEVGQTRSCIPRSDAPGRTSGSRRIHVPHDRRPTAPTSSTPSHAARRASRARRAGCRIGLSAARHTATLAAWSPAVNRAMNRYQRSPKICEYATEYRDVSGARIPRPIARVHGRRDPAVRVWSGSRSRDPSPPRRTGVTVHRTRTTVDATVYSPHNPHVNASGCS